MATSKCTGVTKHLKEATRLVDAAVHCQMNQLAVMYYSMFGNQPSEDFRHIAVSAEHTYLGLFQCFRLKTRF